MKIPLIDGEAGWSAEVKAAVSLLRRKDYAVWPDDDGQRWHVEAMVLSQSAMIDMANGMAARRAA